MHPTLKEKLIQDEEEVSYSYDKSVVKNARVARTEHEKKKTTRYWVWLSSVISSYDLCMVFPLDEGQRLTKFCVHYLEHLSHIGIDFFLCYGLQKDNIFILLRAKTQRLRSYAADIEYQMLLDSKELQAHAEKGDIAKGISPLLIPHFPEESAIRPHEFIYAPYRQEVDESLYWRPASVDGQQQGESHPFRDLVRLKLTESLIETSSGINVDEEVGGEDRANVSIRKHMNSGNITTFFPLHRPEELRKFQQTWLPWGVRPWTAPFFDIKEYFGEKIALYFEFMGHYTKWLRLPACIGLPIQIYMVATGDYNTLAQVVFSVCLVVWAVVMLEYWKRKEKRISMEWGTEDFEETELDRPEFKGQLVKSYTSGKDTVYFPPRERKRKIILSSVIIFAFIVLVIGVVVGIYVMRAALSNPLGSWAQILASVVNAVQIQVFNYLYENLVDDLTEWENHRTDTDFEDSMISKLFLFQFVNSYASFFYIAFIAPSLPSSTGDHGGQGDCAASTCMVPLGLNLAIIFGVQEATTIVSDGIFPYLKYKYRSRELREYAQREFGQMDLPQISKEFLLDRYDILKGALSEYSSVAIQFGYLTLFASALPLAPLVGLVACLLEAKSDTFKFLFLKRRPRMKGIEDIGTWQVIFTLTTTAAIVTNAALSVFTMDIWSHRSTEFRFWFFIIFQWVVFSFQAIVMAAIPDEPVEMGIQRERRKILLDKVIFKISDNNACEDDFPKFDEETIKKFKVHEFSEKHHIEEPPLPAPVPPRPGLTRPDYRIGHHSSRREGYAKASAKASNERAEGREEAERDSQVEESAKASESKEGLPRRRVSAHADTAHHSRQPPHTAQSASHEKGRKRRNRHSIGGSTTLTAPPIETPQQRPAMVRFGGKNKHAEEASEEDGL